VLVHEIQSIRAFGYQIGRADLADEAEKRNGSLEIRDWRLRRSNW
jgi:hypothetical protein